MLVRPSVRFAICFCRGLGSVTSINNCREKQDMNLKPVLLTNLDYTKFSVPIRFKSKAKAKGSVAQVSRTQLPEALIAFIKEEDMIREFNGAINRFQNSLQQRMTLKLTPQMIFDIHLQDVNTSLGQVANLVLQNQSNVDRHSPNVGDQHLLVDLSGRPDLVTSARKAVINFLDPTKDGSGQSRIQSCGPSAFSVRLNTIITQEIRQQMITRGHELLNQVIRELDKIYQSHDKLIHGNSEAKRKFSEDHIYATREYLRSLVKQQHALATSIWQQKQAELKGE